MSAMRLRGNFAILVDLQTKVVLTVSQNQLIMSLLTKSIPSTGAIYNVGHPTPFFFRLNAVGIRKLKALDLLKLSWDKGTQAYVRTNPGVLSDALHEKAKLCNAKRIAIEVMYSALSGIRSAESSGFFAQDTIYVIKRMQAMRFKDIGYDEEKIEDYPLVEQYADYAKIPLREAADEILFKAALYDQNIVKTESFRMKYFNLLKKAQTSEEVG
jgi:hypothetical protein